MAAAHETSTSAQAEEVTSLTWAITVTAGNRLMCGIASSTVAGVSAVTGVTFNGDAASSVGTPAIASTFYAAEAWSMENPDAGAHNVVVSLSGTVSNIVAGASSITGAGTLSGYVTATGVEDDAPGGTVTSAADALVWDVVNFSFPRTATVGADQTVNWDEESSGQQCVSSRQAGAPSVVMSWSFSNPQDWAWLGVSIAAAEGGEPGGLSIPIAAHHYRQMGSE